MQKQEVNGLSGKWKTFEEYILDSSDLSPEEKDAEYRRSLALFDHDEKGNPPLIILI